MEIGGGRQRKREEEKKDSKASMMESLSLPAGMLSLLKISPQQDIPII